MKQIIFYVIFSFSFFFYGIAQITENKDSLDLEPSKIEIPLIYKIGVRVAMDGGYFISNYTPLKSGVSINDVRIRQHMTKGQWEAYIDIDFGTGKFTQNHLYIQYNFEGFTSMRIGYATEPFSLSSLTSQSALHFITRSTPVMVFGIGRSLGVSFKHRNTLYYTETGIYGENLYNSQPFGSQGFSITGRYLFIPIVSEHLSIHMGVSVRFKQIQNGSPNKEGVYTKNITLKSHLESPMDKTIHFLNANINWANKDFRYTPEIVIITPLFFAQGEFLSMTIIRDRPDKLLFEKQLGTSISWKNLESWKKSHPILSPLNFIGTYIEFGCLIYGDTKYKYTLENALLSHLDGNNILELVGRYSYTNLNDIKNNEVYWKGQNKFYPKEAGSMDYPPAESSIMGGILHTATAGINYYFTSNVRTLCHYTYSNIFNYKFQDTHIHTLQLRIQYKF